MNMRAGRAREPRLRERADLQAQVEALSAERDLVRVLGKCGGERAGNRVIVAAMSALRLAPLVCFDNDGTLFASHEVANPAIQREYVRFCREHGLDLPPPTDDEICRLTGKPGPEFYREILPESLKELAPRLRETCLREEVREVGERGRLYAGVPELLTGLRAEGRKIALVTNGGQLYVEAVAERVGYARLLDAIFHYGKDGLGTKGAMLRSALAELHLDRAVMVGDRDSDRKAAQEVGLPFIGCLYGYGSEEELAGSDAIARSVPELAALLLGP